MKLRLTNAVWTILTGMLLFFGGFILVIFGDLGTNWPTYHAGGMYVGSVLLIAMYFIFELVSPPEPPLHSPRIQVAFVSWMILGGLALVAVEIVKPGECCANPTLRQNISFFSLIWPVTFALPAGIFTYVWRRKQGLLTSHPDYL